MPRGLSIHIGLNSVDPAKYGGWDGQLSGCINDARDMKAIADQLGYTSSLMTDSQATGAAVVQAIGQAAQQLSGGDTLLLTYSGHGGQVPDANGDEADGQDETWVLWDRMLIDDELFALWSRFAAGVRIFLLSDSCHSGTVAKMMQYSEMTQSPVMQKAYRRTARSLPPKFRLAPWETTHEIYQRDADMYKSLQWVAGGDRAAVVASVILISGCQDNQLSSDGARNGLFTETLLSVWDGGSFSGTYSTFHGAIMAQMPASQTPNLFKVGTANSAFESEKPFTIGGTAAQPAGRPSITAPAQFTNASTPPTFTVNPGANRYYAVEVTTNPYFFNNAQYGSQRTDDSFFATWKTPPFLGGPYPASYTMPQAPWDRLRAGGGALYYRVWASDAATSWTNAASSTADAQAASAPSIQLTAAGASTAVPAGDQAPTIQAPDSMPYGTTPSFTVNPGAGRFYAVEVTINPYYFMTTEYGAQRSDDNFFASWKARPYLSAPGYPATYTVPQSAWERLRSTGQRLYYRMWATDDANAWRNASCTTPDAQALQARSFAIAREAAPEGRGTPDIATPLYNACLHAMAIQDNMGASESFTAFLAVAAPDDSRRAYIQRKMKELTAAAPR
ncbi:MAG: caspase family protein [Betaproteobacteria bacterium]|nr:caspase family protein [Betaproteobacteria bacterium]